MTSKLEELIAELCPNGVEYKALSDVSDMKRGTTVTKKSVNPGDIPVISGGREPAYYCDISNRNGETITVAGSGAGAGFVQYWDKPIFVCDAFSVKGVNDLTLTKFLYYVLLSKQEAIYATKKGGGVPHVHISSIKDFEIPVPPLEVQAEIVRILDTFTELTAELTAELTDRKKQYEYYRDTLLTFNDNNPLHSLISRYCPNGVEYKKLGDIAFISTGSKLSDIQESPSLYEYINAGTTNSGYSLDWNCDGDVVTTPSRGQGGIGYVGYQKNKFWLGPLCYKIAGNADFVLNKYLYYCLSNNSYAILSLKKDGGVPAINKSDLEELVLPIPPLEVQNQIVQILDRFDALCNDLTQGLPAEIEARRKQYEYYRDQLLTFKRA
ncbi:restriction endonuclease subunit S [Gardnerella vaginalis]|uniref:Type I restriction modification DNA specificity domain protein n=1 Tax=Gardnerella pickettii JCP8017A TaxID=1261062 RepID=T2PPH5_9BIFI|nr:MULTISPECIES: restriction endonuclease subunit S [Gardnerella]EPI53354.1 type I restriction modification DNA specificity domain protein [Gardnerella pickettii JCP8017A]EPI61473.1 type I restriction modification DNA specificity domain protein [Gardnerella pickettii JCP8017B]RDW97277.1 restriction endonuclease subunit S [Gardnerella vaginalis]RDW97604.1 restriction endonuclease subunit S [Gardnerella vaginalis]